MPRTRARTARSGAGAEPALAPLDGGCACGALRYRLLAPPLFVHCCHCTRCQRETGGPFAHHAMIEFSQFTVVQGEAQFVEVPTDSGRKHWVARCASCLTALWNEHGSRSSVTRYVRVGTLDRPEACPPRAHIFVRSRQPWLVLPPEVPSYAGFYDAARTWPPESLARYEAAAEARRAEARAPAAKRGARQDRADR
jgi:hypothetical protein